MNNRSERISKATQAFHTNDPASLEFAMIDIMHEIEESPAHIELPQDIQSTLDVLVSKIISRSWPDDILAMGFFVLGKAAIYPGKIDIAKIACSVLTKVCTENEARQILVGIENQILSDRNMDLNAAKTILEHLHKSPKVWVSDACLTARVIQELSDKTEQE